MLNKINRDELYLKVWSTPASILCNEYGISGRGLKKICVKLNVPTPGRGYWSQLASGLNPDKTPLPQHSDKQEAEISRQKPELITNNVTIPTIPVPARLSNPHNLITLTKNYKTLNDRERWKSPDREKVLDVRVFDKALPRALRIMDTIVKALEAQGAKIVVSASRETIAVIAGQKVPFFIQEYTTRQVLEDLEKKKSDVLYRPEIRFIPNGRLQFKIDGWAEQLRDSWQDGKRQKVEDFVGEIVTTFSLFADYWNKRDQERALERIIEQREAAIREEEDNRIKRLEKELGKYQKLLNLQRYIAFLREVNKMPDSTWIDWAEGYTKRLRDSFGNI